jgi:hypothetical protein
LNQVPIFQKYDGVSNVGPLAAADVPPPGSWWALFRIGWFGLTELGHPGSAKELEPHTAQRATAGIDAMAAARSLAEIPSRQLSIKLFPVLAALAKVLALARLNLRAAARP